MNYTTTRNKRGDTLYWKIDSRGRKRRIKKPTSSRKLTSSKVVMPNFAPSIDYWGGWFSGGQFPNTDYSYTVEWTPEGNLKWRAGKIGSAGNRRWTKNALHSYFTEIY